MTSWPSKIGLICSCRAHVLQEVSLAAPVWLFPAGQIISSPSAGHAWRGPSSVRFLMICPDIWLCWGNLSAPGKPGISGIGKVQKKWIRKHQRIASVFPAGNTPSRCAAIHKHGISSNLKVRSFSLQKPPWSFVGTDKFDTPWGPLLALFPKASSLAEAVA